MTFVPQTTVVPVSLQLLQLSGSLVLATIRRYPAKANQLNTTSRSSSSQPPYSSKSNAGRYAGISYPDCCRLSVPDKRGYRRCGVLGLDLSGFPTNQDLATRSSDKVRVADHSGIAHQKRVYRY